MKLRRIAVVLAAIGLLAGVAPAQKIEPEVFTLDNGMKFLLVPRDDQPNSIAAGWLAQVGSVDERPGITGISHFFEHMMFKGTTAIGTSDAAQDAAFIARLNEIRSELLEEHLTTQYERFRLGEIDDPWDPEHDTPQMSKLRNELREVTEDHRDIIVKNEFDRVYTNLGASGMNAFTSYDLTFYFITVPSNKFELWAWMESDRLKGSVFREFFSERDVVHEERRLRTESTPTGEFDEQFEAMFWLSSPYGWPVIGWPSDLNAYTREQAEQFYETYYAPNNLVGVVVGDFDLPEVKRTIEEYFSSLERGPEPPEVVTLEIPHKAEMRMNAEGDMQPQIKVRYLTVPMVHEDNAPLTVLSQVLNGRTGRLYKAMVEGREVAASAGAIQNALAHEGYFQFSAETKGDASPEDLEEAFYEIIDEIRENGVPDRELQKVKNQFLANQYRRLESNFFLLVQLGYYEALGGWEWINKEPELVEAVTGEDIRRVIEDYFSKENRAVAVYTRSADAEPIDPMLAAIPQEIRGQVRQQAAQIRQIPDPATLRQVLQQLQTQASSGQVPEQYQAALEYMMKVVQDRITALETDSE